MTVVRAVAGVFASRPTLEGAGVHLRRVFGYDQVPLFDPFLMMDDFRSDEPQHFRKGFPWHPHRGIETVTYLLRGDVEHADSMGNSGIDRLRLRAVDDGGVRHRAPGDAARG